MSGAYKKLMNKAIKEMESGWVVLLKRGDKVPEGSYEKYKNLLAAIKAISEEPEEATMIEKMNELFETQEEFIYDLFETNGFKKLLELYEYA